MLSMMPDVPVCIFAPAFAIVSVVEVIGHRARSICRRVRSRQQPADDASDQHDRDQHERGRPGHLLVVWRRVTPSSLKMTIGIDAIAWLRVGRDRGARRSTR